MVLMSKSLNHSFHYRSIAVNLAKPPGTSKLVCALCSEYGNQCDLYTLDSFRKYGIRRVPALQDGDQIVDNIDDIVTYLEVLYCYDILRYVTQKVMETGTRKQH